MRRLLSLPYTFVLLNWAALVALYYFITGKQDVWVKTRNLARNSDTAAARPPILVNKE